MPKDLSVHHFANSVPVEGGFPQHVEKREPDPNPICFDTWSNCSCGARWSHPESRTEEEKDSIWASHVKYFNRTTEVL